jgi:hypothetical protein
MNAMRSFLALILCAGAVFAAKPTGPKTKHIIFVMTDGLRWQEVFNGADEALMSKENGNVEDVPALKKAFWRATPEERREVLMPFLWKTIGKNGQIYGNRKAGAEAYVTNGKNFSYPGYNETLTGFADPRIDSNDKVLNPNMTVMEWLNKKPAYKNKIAAFGAWDVFPYIFNAQRAGFIVNAGYEPFTGMTVTPRLDMLNVLKAESPRVWNDEVFDPIVFHTALEYLESRKPRVLYLSLGETDDWAHAGNYKEYLVAAQRVDAYLKKLWDTVQAIPEYKDSTTLIVSVDHGRGEAPVEWKSHGAKIPDSKYMWMAFMGPDTPALGERTKIPAVTQSQIAATLAALMGENYGADVPKAGKPISDVLTK